LAAGEIYEPDLAKFKKLGDESQQYAPAFAAFPIHIGSIPLAET